MAVDYQPLRDHLRGFCDFTGKVVLYVGAGGTQLLDPAVRASKLIAIDRNPESMGELKAHAQPPVEFVAADFAEVVATGDVVYFEFCLHEMRDPTQALHHARWLAPGIVVFDHLPDSEWSYYGAEEEAVRRSADAMARFGVRRRQEFRTEQRFIIPMPYELALL